MPSPFLFGGGGGTHSLAGEGVGRSQFQRGDRHYGTLGTYVLCVADTDDGNARGRCEAGGHQPQYQYEPQGRFASPFKRYF